ncbi:MAG: hypothetical protein QM817_17005 [Archangium sp.]
MSRESRARLEELQTRLRTLRGSSAATSERDKVAEEVIEQRRSLEQQVQRARRELQRLERDLVAAAKKPPKSHPSRVAAIAVLVPMYVPVALLILLGLLLALSPENPVWTLSGFVVGGLIVAYQVSKLVPGAPPPK